MIPCDGVSKVFPEGEPSISNYQMMDTAGEPRLFRRAECCIPQFLRCRIMEQLYLAVSWALVGLIWVIQLVKYPAFHFVTEERFLKYHGHHERSITAIVLPLMVTELALSFWICLQNDWTLEAVCALLAVLTIWLSTFLIQIPLHRKLEKGKDEKAIEKLVRTNWIRTILWTGKGIFLLLI